MTGDARRMQRPRGGRAWQSSWACDHAATVGPINSVAASTCFALYETLKQRKFNNDFNAMLAWWRQHKEAEYLALETRAPKADKRGAALRQR